MSKSKPALFPQSAQEAELFDFAFGRAVEVLNQLPNDTRQDIYVLSLLCEMDRLAEIGIGLGYNTTTRWKACSPKRGQKAEWPIASDSAEAKWNYAFWLQDETPLLSPGPGAENSTLVRAWLEASGCWTEELKNDAEFQTYFETIERAGSQCWNLATTIALKLRESGTIESVFGRDLPIIIHDVEMGEDCESPSRRANPAGQAKAFLSNL